MCIRDSLGGAPESVDVRQAKSGDRCVHNSNAILKECRGIEVGHIFQLGRKYSKSLNANFTNEEGGQEPFWMGCYGIGVSRLAQAAIEQNNDESGIIWPLAIAPYEVIITIANMQDSGQKELGENLYKQLKEEKVDALIDDRNERAGIKFKDADLIGIPWRITVGRDAESDQVELFERSTKNTRLLRSQLAVKELLKEISTKKNPDVPSSI